MAPASATPSLPDGVGDTEDDRTPEDATDSADEGPPAAERTEDSAPGRLAATLAAERRTAAAHAPPVGAGEAAAAAAALELGDTDDGPPAVRPVVVVLAFVAVIGLGLIAWLLFGSTSTESVDDASAVTRTGDDTTEPPTDTGTSVDEVADDDPVQVEAATAVDAEPTTEPEPTEAADPEPTTEPEPTEAADPEPTTDPEPEPAATAEPTTEPEPDPLEGLLPLSELPERGAVFVAAEQKLYLRGPVTEQEGAVLEARAIEVLGSDRVVNEYIYRPDAPPVTEGNVRVEQAVLFEVGSAVIAEPFLPTLELGVLVMALNPQVTMVIEGHTDDVGSDEDNQRLSEARAEAVADYLVERGIDRARLQPIGLGETEPIADNETAEGRQRNRRIEVELLDLIGPRPDDTGG